MKINDIERQNILEMHSKMRKNVIKEQVSDKKVTLTLEQELQELLDSGCIPFGTIVKMNSSNPRMQYAIKQESKKTPGKFRYAFIDKRVGISENGKFTFLTDKWECAKKPEVPVKPEGPKKLNQAQIDALAELKQMGDWAPEPVPSQFLIDNGTWEKVNIADESDPILGRKYAKYFKDDYPKGYFVYRKVKKQGPVPGKAEKIEVTAESCKTSIESLHDHMKSPRTYPLSNEQINAFVATAQMCAEPANKKIFLLRFGLDKKLDRIARKYGIEL